MPNQTPRVRFAPSPTGMLHVGNARTALYNWLFARHNGGDFVLRIEDTDVERSEVRFEEQLIAEGKAYRCFCTAEELEQERQLALSQHRTQVYSGKCRTVTVTEATARAAAGDSFAVRLAVPDAPLRFHDIVRGGVEFASEAVVDFILVRSSGIPVYNYVVTIDDALMHITHVIRGDDHISN